MIPNEDDFLNLPVLVVTTNDGKLVHAGRPDLFSGKTIGKYAKLGYQIKTIPLKEYRETKWTWHWGK